MDRTTYGLDIAKSVMQLHWVEAETGEIGRKKLARAKLAEYFAQLQTVRVVMEACGSAHHWARVLGKLGHEVELLPAAQVRPFVRSNKDDAADARAIWLAAQQSDIRRVPLKSCEQQAVLALHRTRSHWICVRTATVNVLRGLLYEFGVVLRGGRKAGLKALAEQRAQIDEQVPQILRGSVDGQFQTLKEVQPKSDRRGCSTSAGLKRWHGDKDKLSNWRRPWKRVVSSCATRRRLFPRKPSAWSISLVVDPRRPSSMYSRCRC